VVCETFLVLNGVMLTVNDVDCVLIMQHTAAGEITEFEFATWILNNLKPSYLFVRICSIKKSAFAGLLIEQMDSRFSH